MKWFGSDNTAVSLAVAGAAVLAVGIDHAGSAVLPALITGAGAAISSMGIVVSDRRKIRRLTKDRRRLRRALATDPITGLGNQQAFNRARPGIDTDTSFAIATFDATQFKRINDEFGHQVGDDVLRHFANTIRRVTQQFGAPLRAFRLGGDEYVCAIPTQIAHAFVCCVEEQSRFARSGVRTWLTGASGESYMVADQRLLTKKELQRNRDPTLRRRDS